MLIRVTREHIKRGKRGLCTTCPIALAISEALPGSQPMVFPAQIQIRRHGRTMIVLLPETATEFIRDFDAGNKQAPFEFELPLKEAA